MVVDAFCHPGHGETEAVESSSFYSSEGLTYRSVGLCLIKPLAPWLAFLAQRCGDSGYFGGSEADQYTSLHRQP